MKLEVGNAVFGHSTYFKNTYFPGCSEKKYRDPYQFVLVYVFFLRNPLNRHYINSSREVESLPFS